MTLKLLKKLLESEEYQELSVKEFVDACKSSKMWDEGEDELAFLTDPNWKPTSVIYNGEKREL